MIWTGRRRRPRRARHEYWRARGRPGRLALSPSFAYSQCTGLYLGSYKAFDVLKHRHAENEEYYRQKVSKYHRQSVSYRMVSCVTPSRLTRHECTYALLLAPEGHQPGRHPRRRRAVAGRREWIARAARRALLGACCGGTCGGTFRGTCRGGACRGACCRACRGACCCLK